MKLHKEHREEFCHIEALDNVPKRSVQGSGTKAWVHKAEQPSKRELCTSLLGEVEHTCIGTETHCPEKDEKGARINNR